MLCEQEHAVCIHSTRCTSQQQEEFDLLPRWYQLWVSWSTMQVLHSQDSFVTVRHTLVSCQFKSHRVTSCQVTSCQFSHITSQIEEAIKTIYQAVFTLPMQGSLSPASKAHAMYTYMQCLMCDILSIHKNVKDRCKC